MPNFTEHQNRSECLETLFKKHTTKKGDLFITNNPLSLYEFIRGFLVADADKNKEAFENVYCQFKHLHHRWEGNYELSSWVKMTEGDKNKLIDSLAKSDLTLRSINRFETASFWSKTSQVTDSDEIESEQKPPAPNI